MIKVKFHGLPYREFDGDRVHGRNIGKLTIDFRREYERLLPMLVEQGIKKTLIDTINNTFTVIIMLYIATAISMYIHHSLYGSSLILLSPLVCTLPVLLLMRTITLIENMLYTRTLTSYMRHIEYFASKQIMANPDILFSDSVTSRYYVKIYSRLDFIINRDSRIKTLVRIFHIREFLKDSMSAPLTESILIAKQFKALNMTACRKWPEFEMFTLKDFLCRLRQYAVTLWRSFKMPCELRNKAFEYIARDIALMNPSLGTKLFKLINREAVNEQYYS